jgi:hypothetical protein
MAAYLLALNTNIFYFFFCCINLYPKQISKIFISFSHYLSNFKFPPNPSPPFSTPPSLSISDFLFKPGDQKE